MHWCWFCNIDPKNIVSNLENVLSAINKKKKRIKKNTKFLELTDTHSWCNRGNSRLYHGPKRKRHLYSLYVSIGAWWLIMIKLVALVKLTTARATWCSIFILKPRRFINTSCLWSSFRVSTRTMWQHVVLLHHMNHKLHSSWINNNLVSPLTATATKSQEISCF